MYRMAEQPSTKDECSSNPFKSNSEHHCDALSASTADLSGQTSSKACAAGQMPHAAQSLSGQTEQAGSVDDVDLQRHSLLVRRLVAGEICSISHHIYI